MASSSGRPLAFSLIQVDAAPDGWRDLLDKVAAANDAGVRITPQVATRPIGVLFGLTATLNPFLGHAAYREIADLPLDQRVERLRDVDFRARLLAEEPDAGFAAFLAKALQRTFELGEIPDYEPAPDQSLAARAAREGRTIWEVALDLLVERDGTALLYHPFENYAEGDLEAVREMFVSPHTVSGLSDGGAHVGTICDASFPTYLLTHWTRDRTRGERIPLADAVHRQTEKTALSVGLDDRGVLAPGYRADVNVVDLDGLTLHAPQMVYDLPTGGKRLVQRADGYRHTFVKGVETFTDGEWTGATPGRLVRSRT
jgi:N-acyl-D-aspartate/D-glutamate deacylase